MIRNGTGGGHASATYEGKQAPPRRYRDPAQAFAARTERRGECLIWTGAKGRRGYGQLKVSGRKMQAHRFAWEQVHGPIPEGVLIDHRYHCDTACCEVEHLREASPAENLRNRGGTSAASGHRNVYANGRGWAVVLSIDNSPVHFGTYPTVEEAAAVATAKRAELYGEFAGKG